MSDNSDDLVSRIAIAIIREMKIDNGRALIMGEPLVDADRSVLIDGSFNIMRIAAALAKEFGTHQKRGR
jgi:hypothetical protein